MPVNEQWLTEQVREESHRTLLRRIVASDERLDGIGFGEVLTDDASFRFGSGPATTGKANIVPLVTGFLSQLKAFRHELFVAWESPGMLAYEAQVTYLRHDDRTVVLPYANVLRLRGALIHDYRIYIDIAPLFAP